MTILSDDTKLRLLLEISSQIRSKVEKTLNLDATLEMVLETVGRVVPYDIARVHVSANDQGLDRTLVRRAAQDGAPSSSDAPEIYDPSAVSQLEAPITFRDRVIGSLSLQFREPGKYSETDSEILNFFASEVSSTIEKALLHEQLLIKEKIEGELEFARQVQLSLLPAQVPLAEGFDIASVSMPAERVGGDYYDFIEFPHQNLGLVIADVVGKGMSAALIMASFRAFLRAQIRNDYAIATIFRKVNNLLKEGLEDNRFVTAVYGVLDVPNRVLTYCNAGHNPPVLLHADGAVDRLTRGGLIMGVFRGAEYKESRKQLKPGDVLILYTDGLIEAQDQLDREYGAERLIQTAQAKRTASATELGDWILSDVASHRGETPLRDDLTLVVVKAL
ncbi:MAG TPA: GAF domain-containing SpoIIE family protein phosphatase [Acidobacteriota bacterium]